MFGTGFLLFLLLLPVASQTCDEQKIQTTQECFKILEFPPAGSEKETICKYVEAGMQCFENECCKDERYTVAVKQIQDQASKAGCTSVVCGSEVSASASPTVSLSIGFSVLLLLLVTVV